MDSIKAHEALHTTQFENWPLGKFYRFIAQKSEPCDGNRRILRKEKLEEAAARFGIKEDEVAPAFLKAEKSLSEMKLHYEIAARMLIPKVKTKDNGEATWELNDILSKHPEYRFTQKEIQRALQTIPFVFGHYLETRPERTDIAASEFIGSINSREEIVKRITRLIGSSDGREYSSQGLDFLTNRSRCLRQVPEEVYKILEEYI